MATRKMSRQCRKQNGERDLVGCFLTPCAFNETNHVIEEALAGIGRNADLDPVGQNLCASCNRTAVSSRLPDYRSGLPRYGRFINGGHPLDDLSIRRDDLTSRNEHDLALAQFFGRGLFERSVRAQAVCRSLCARSSKGIGLGLSAALGKRLCEIGKKHREPEPEGYLEAKCYRIAVLPEEKPKSRDCGSYLGHEHDRVFHHRARIELLDRLESGL